MVGLSIPGVQVWNKVNHSFELKVSIYMAMNTTYDSWSIDKVGMKSFIIENYSAESGKAPLN